MGKKKKLVGHFYVCNNSEKLFLTNGINISFLVSRIDNIFLWGYVSISIRLLLMSRIFMFLDNFRQN